MRLDFEERKVLITCTFVSACITFLPGEWVSGSFLLLATFALYRVHLKMTAREAAAKALAAGSAAPTAPPAAEAAGPSSAAS